MARYLVIVVAFLFRLDSSLKVTESLSYSSPGRQKACVLQWREDCRIGLENLFGTFV